jgi:sRNA-binding protein
VQTKVQSEVQNSDEQLAQYCDALLALDRKYYGVIPKNKLVELKDEYKGAAYNVSHEQLIETAKEKAGKKKTKEKEEAEAKEAKEKEEAEAKEDELYFNATGLSRKQLTECFFLLKQQLPDHKFDRSKNGGRWVIATRVRDTLHSDSSNPQSEHEVSVDLYDLRGFKNGTLFTSLHHESWSAWKSRGGCSGHIGSMAFEDTFLDGAGDKCLLQLNGKLFEITSGDGKEGGESTR